MTKTEIKELKKIKAQFVEDIMSYCVDDFIDIYLRQFGTVSKSLKDDIRKHLMELQYEVEDIIKKDLPVSFEEMTLEKAKEVGAMGVFESKYGEKVKVYTVGKGGEICGMAQCGGSCPGGRESFYGL